VCASTNRLSGSSDAVSGERVAGSACTGAAAAATNRATITDELSRRSRNPSKSPKRCSSIPSVSCPMFQPRYCWNSAQSCRPDERSNFRCSCPRMAASAPELDATRRVSAPAFRTGGGRRFRVIIRCTRRYGCCRTSGTCAAGALSGRSDVHSRVERTGTVFDSSTSPSKATTCPDRGGQKTRCASRAECRGLAVRMARRLNRMMDRRGDVFADRYHAHQLRSPTEVARAIAYVLGNFFVHARRRGEQVAESVDPFCSAANDAVAVPLTSPARTWLLSVGWKRARHKPS
jgi:hypothetical protein